MRRFEPHIHTAEVSACSHMPAELAVRRVREVGYDGMMVTDHFYSGFVDAAPRNPAALARAFFEGFYRACDEGERTGFTVLPGMELRYRHARTGSNDYLVFGMDEEKLSQMGDITLLDPEEGFRLLDEAGCLIVQAHPFRSGMTPAEWVHGCEVFNAHPWHDSRNHLARAWWARHPGWVATAGSDAHEAEHVGLAGFFLPPEAMESGAALIECLKSGGAKLFGTEDNIRDGAR